MPKSEDENTTTDRRSNERRRGLGRGLGALIPQSPATHLDGSVDPKDILFPDLLDENSNNDRGTPTRGGSARDLLSPRRGASQSPGKTVVSRETTVGGVTKVNSVSRETRSGNAEVDTSLVKVPGVDFALLTISQIIPNTKQPRQIFDESELEELSDSIREVGLLQPIVVRPLGRDQKTSLIETGVITDPQAVNYELVMGERRWRASQLAGLEAIPAIVRVTEDDDLLRDALLENLHRVQLNPLEEAAAYEQLLREFNCTQEELSGKIARSRPQIANTLRLLRLPSTVQTQVAAGLLSAGHARALLSLESSEKIAALAKRILAEGLSVRTTEEIVRQSKPDSEARRKKLSQRPPSATVLRVIERMSEKLDTQVQITEGAKKGKLIIEFADEGDLERIVGLLAD